MGRRPRWQALVELPSLWFALQLAELVIAIGLLILVVPKGWSRLERLASALLVYALLTVLNYVLIARSHPKPQPPEDVVVVPEAAERTDHPTHSS
jgi:hypothetical protein